MAYFWQNPVASLRENADNDWIVSVAGLKDRRFRSASRAYDYVIRQQDIHGRSLVHVERNGYEAGRELADTAYAEDEKRAR